MFRKNRKPKIPSPREYRKHLIQLAHSGIRKRPTPYIGETLERGTDEEKRAYEKSKFFQVYLNQTRGSGFCFNEEEGTNCVIDTFDQPDRGRRYLVSYNSLDIGKIEIRLGYDLWDADKNNGETLALYFDFNMLEFLEYREAVGLLQQLALAMMPLGNTNDDHQASRRLANDQMLEALWNHRYHETIWNWSADEKPQLIVTGQFSGPAGYYLHALEHWRKNYDLLAEPCRDGLPTGRKDI